jgi:DNA-directed RNA polymerase specialized sigma24 family protein
MSTTTIVPQHELRRRAVDLSRCIYASLPWGYRVAGLLLVLAAASLDTFGRVMYAEFIKSVVRGMPDVAPGKTAFDLVQDVERKGADVLPAGYGRPFASRLYKVLLSKLGDPEVAQEAMSKVMLQVVRGKVHIHNGADLHSAEAYVVTACLNAGRDVLRAQGRRREQSLVRERDDEERAVEVEDPEAFAKLDKLMPASELRDILRELADVHPRAPEWLRARLDGDSGQEIANEWQTTPSYVSKWQRQYLPEIKRVVEHHLRLARVEYSYDRRFAKPPRSSARSRGEPALYDFRSISG